MRIIKTIARAPIAILVFLYSIAAHATPVPDSFARFIENIASAATKGAKAVQDEWPGQTLAFPGEDRGPARSLLSGPFPLGEGLRTAGSEVRLAKNGDAVQLIIVKLEGPCITPADIEKKYQTTESVIFPQPNNPNPVQYQRVDVAGAQVSFGFRGQPPGCLTDAVINPVP